MGIICGAALEKRPTLRTSEGGSGDALTLRMAGRTTLTLDNHAAAAGRSLLVRLERTSSVATERGHGSHLGMDSMRS